MKIAVVLGLGYGDEGKGLMTDYLVRKFHEGTETVVVRFSGGQQAGHTVVTDNTSHIFSNYGAGSLAGASSYFSEHCTIYPPNILNERAALIQKGGNVNLVIHPLASLTTHYDIAYNRFLENTRRKDSNSHHGSCGLGIGATIERNTTSPYRLYAADLLYPSLLNKKLRGIADYYNHKIHNERDANIQTNYRTFIDIANDHFQNFHEACLHVFENKIIEIKGYGYFKNKKALIFEGSQGILLDQDHGLFPHVTRGNTTSKNAFDIMSKIDADLSTASIYYMTRCYQTRHGAGWMSKEWDDNKINDSTNVYNEWQENIRSGDFDYEAINYALSVDSGYSRSKYKYLVVTHRDERPDFCLDTNKIPGYFNHRILASHGPKATDVLKWDEEMQKFASSLLNDPLWNNL